MKTVYRYMQILYRLLISKNIVFYKDVLTTILIVRFDGLCVISLLCIQLSNGCVAYEQVSSYRFVLTLSCKNLSDYINSMYYK